MAEMTLEELRTWIAGSEDFDGVHQRAEACAAAAIKQREQDAKDAERYRWLADVCGDADLFMETRNKTELDRRVDAAMAKESGND